MIIFVDIAKTFCILNFRKRKWFLKSLSFFFILLSLSLFLLLATSTRSTHCNNQLNWFLSIHKPVVTEYNQLSPFQFPPTFYTVHLMWSCFANHKRMNKFSILLCSDDMHLASIANQYHKSTLYSELNFEHTKHFNAVHGSYQCCRRRCHWWASSRRE